MTFGLGSLTTLNVQDWQGFTYPETAETLLLLENAVGSTLNAVLQQSALGFREATISGVVDSSDADTLRGWAADKSTQSFTDDESNSFAVVVMDLSVRRIFIDLWEYGCKLVEVA